MSKSDKDVSAPTVGVDLEAFPDLHTSADGQASFGDHPIEETSYTQSLTTAEWIGPLPPPSIIKDFDNVVPDGAERIFRQFEIEAAHRRECEKAEILTARIDLVGGQLLVLFFLAGAYAVTAYAILQGAFWIGGIIGVLTTVMTIYFGARGREKNVDDAEESEVSENGFSGEEVVDDAGNPTTKAAGLDN